MRHAVSCLLALCLLAPVFGQSKPATEPTKTATTPENDEKLIQKIEDDLLAGERNTNIQVQERVLADDYVNLITGGLGPGKAGIIAYLREREGSAPPYLVETRDMHIYILDNTAVAAFTKTYTAKENGNVAHEDTTHIFTRDHGVWKLKISRATIRE